MKTRLVRSFFVTILCLSLAGCSNLFGDNESEPAQQAVSFEVLANDAVRVEQLESGSYSDLRDGNSKLIESQDAFETLWNDIHADQSNVPPLPSVNFEESVVVSIILGGRSTSGYEIEISDVQLNTEQGMLEVNALERQPSGTCIVNHVMTSPYLIARVNVDAPVEEASFEWSQEAYTCDN